MLLNSSKYCHGDISIQILEQSIMSRLSMFMTLKHVQCSYVINLVLIGSSMCYITNKSHIPHIPFSKDCTLTGQWMVLPLRVPVLIRLGEVRWSWLGGRRSDFTVSLISWLFGPCFLRTWPWPLSSYEFGTSSVETLRPGTLCSQSVVQKVLLLMNMAVVLF